MAICRIHFHAIVLKPVYNGMGTRELRSSLFKKKSWLLSYTKGGVLSAKLQTLKSRKKNKSFKYKLNSNGPRTEPCGTSWNNSFQELNNIFFSSLPMI